MTDMLAEMKAARAELALPECKDWLVVRALDVAIGLAEALAKIEWTPDSRSGVPVCVACQGIKPTHRVSCTTQEALAAAQAKWEGK